MTADYRDTVIEQLADAEATLTDQIVELTVWRDTFRELAQQAIHALHELTVEHNQLRERDRRLLAEYRALRVQTMREPEAA